MENIEMTYDGRTDYLNQNGYFGGIYFRKWGPLENGHMIGGHQHEIDHVTSVMTGSIRVRYRKTETDEPYKSAVFIAPINFIVRADTFHEITALEDNTSYQCIFAIPEGGTYPGETAFGPKVD